MRVREAGTVDRAAGPSDEQIRVESVTKTYPGAPQPALWDVDLTVSRGEFVSLIGPSGCGKTTLLRILAGLLRVDSGRVTLFSEEPAVACARKHIGFVPQTPALLPRRTTRDNVRLAHFVNRRTKLQIPDGVTERRFAEDLLAKMGLGGKGDLRPAQISGGMQQRVAIARAFMVDGPVLLMDEPFSAVDELTREVLRRVLLSAWEGTHKTVVFVTHSVPESVTLSDRVVVMAPNPGRVHSIHSVSLPRPRDPDVQSSPECVRSTAEIRDQLMQAWRKGPARDDL